MKFASVVRAETSDIKANKKAKKYYHGYKTSNAVGYKCKLNQHSLCSKRTCTCECHAYKHTYQS